MKIRELLCPRDGQKDILDQVKEITPKGEEIVRCVFTDREVSVASVPERSNHKPYPNQCEFQERAYENHEEFNIALVIPTGVGASVGGHAGDATPTIRMLSTLADRVFTHPNVVNASDLNEQPDNALYIEGSILARFLMGTIGLQPVRKNRLLVLVGSHPEDVYEIAAINAVNAARATFGVDVAEIVQFHDCEMSIQISESGRATGVVENVSEIANILSSRDDYDAVAVTSLIRTDATIRDEYYQSDGNYVNPWGGIEALLTHWVSNFCDKPSAHAPMMESSEVESIDYGVIDPRMSAEIISITYLQCVLKGLMRAPRISYDLTRPDVLTASNVNALVIPAGCYGLPVVAALRQGITVIAVRDNLQAYACQEFVRELPWTAGQYIEAENYFEAAGYLAALKEGLSIESVKRPISKAKATNFSFDTEHPAKRMITAPHEEQPVASANGANGTPSVQPSLKTKE